MREAWRRRRTPEAPARRPRHGRKPEDDGKGER